MASEVHFIISLNGGHTSNHNFSLLMLTLITLQKKFLHNNVIFPSLVHCTCWKSLPKAHIASASWPCSIYINYLKLFCQRYVSFPFTYLFIYAWPHEYLFLCWVIIQHHFVAQSWSLWAPAVGPSVHLAYHYKCGFCLFLSTSYFLAPPIFKAHFLCIFCPRQARFFIMIFVSPFETIFCVVGH